MLLCAGLSTDGGRVGARRLATVAQAFLPPQGGVAATGDQELVVGTALDDPSAVEHDDLVHPLQPVNLWVMSSVDRPS